ncbi:MAG: DivIVA domain-containing protein [Sarcina sp.]
MKLTPMEINNKEFKKGIRGYVQDEVDEFLDRVVEEYEALYKENSKLKEKLENANEKLNHHSQMESTIQSTLILAQETAEQSRKTAQDEADRIIRKANDTAQKILDKAHSDVLQINDDYDLVKQEFIKFRAKFRNFMNFQMETFDDLERDFVKNFNVTKPESEEAIEEKGIEISDFDYTREVNISSLNNVDDEDVMMDDDMKEIKSYFAEN